MKSFSPIAARSRNFFRRKGLIGDASWLAVPYLSGFGGTIVHQVREPMSVIASFHAIRFFDAARRDNPFAQFARRHFWIGDDPVRAAIRWYIEWNLMCEALTDRRFRIEAAMERPAMLFDELGLAQPTAKPQIPKDTNKKSRLDDTGLAELFERVSTAPELTGLREMADRYGYPVPI